MNDKEKMEIAIEILQIKRVIATNNAKKGEFDELREEINRINKEEKSVYENVEEVINKVLTVYLQEIKEYMEAKNG